MRAVRGIIAVSISLIALGVWAVVTNPSLWPMLGPMLVFSPFALAAALYIFPYAISGFRLARLARQYPQSMREGYHQDLGALFSDMPTKLGVWWDFALQPVRDIAYELALKAFHSLSQSFNVGDYRYREWLGLDAYEVFYRLQVVAGFGGYRELDRMMAAGVTDFKSFLGKCEVAGFEAAMISVEQDIPLEYAAALAPPAESQYWLGFEGQPMKFGPFTSSAYAEDAIATYQSHWTEPFVIIEEPVRA